MDFYTTHTHTVLSACYTCTSARSIKQKGKTMHYGTLDEALVDIARRSFYESARVVKDDTGYTVEDWHTGVDEYVPWSYDDGPTVPSEAVDYSRTHEPYEYYETASHVRYNLPTAVEAIEAGQAVGFTYVITEAACEDDNPEECMEDHAAGWLLIATAE